MPILTDCDLKTILFSLKPNKSVGTDGISISELRRNYACMSAVLLAIIKDIVSCGDIPVRMKTAIIIPLYKKGSRDKVENYRPISILSCLTQISEKHILLTMNSFLYTHNTLSPQQYGFRKGKCTQALLVDFSDFLNFCLEGNQVACTLFLD